MRLTSEPRSVTGRDSREETNLGGIFAALRIRLQERELAWGLALVLLVFVCGVLLTAQGWRSRTPAHDLVPHIHNVRNLVAIGAIPQHGDTGSYGSYKTPGTAWLMLPSTLLFPDPRLTEYTGTAILHLATLLGIFLLARRLFGIWCACLGVVLYGLSETGIFLAGSLWPNGRPDFFIWFTYFASQWAIHKEARALAVAAAIWGVGMNVDLALLPAIFILPALWIYYRPPVQLKPLLITGVLLLIVCSPYLRFQAGRGFADIRSQVLFQNIFPANYRDSWCDSSIVLRQLGSAEEPAPLGAALPQPSQRSSPGLLHSAFTFVDEIRGKLVYNFHAIAPVPGASLILLLVVLSSLVWFTVSGSEPGTRGSLPGQRLWKDRLLVGIGMVVTGLLAHEFVLARLLGIEGGLELAAVSTIRKIQKLLVLGGASLLAGRGLAAVIDQLLRRAGLQLQSREHADQVRTVVLSLAVPWFILLLIAEPGKPERFWWLWPLQVIFLAAFATWLFPRLRVPRPVTGIAIAGLLLVILANSFLISRLQDWSRSGWAGADAPEVQVIDYVASQVKAGGRDHAAIGYHLYIYQFMAAYNITNPQYKVGNDFDLLFKYLHKISNTDQCAEGFSPEDEFRIVQTQPRAESWAPREYFDVPLDRSFQLVGQFGPYQVFRRQ